MATLIALFAKEFPGYIFSRILINFSIFEENFISVHQQSSYLLRRLTADYQELLNNAGHKG